MDLKPRPPDSDRYIIRFDREGHRDKLKEAAKRSKRTLNKHLLLLIEAGEAALESKAVAQ